MFSRFNLFKLTICLNVIFFIILFFSACKTRKGLPIKSKEKITPVVDNRPALQLVKKQKENELKFLWFSAKADIETEINGEKQNLNATIRIKHDSVIWISISAILGLEVARIYITPDSVKFMNRLNSTYIIEDINKLNELIQADFDFEMVQNLLIGNSFDYYDDDRLKTSIEDNNYLISSVKKRKVRKAAANFNSPSTKQEPLQSIWLDPQTFKMIKSELVDFATRRTFNVTYNKYDTIDSIQLAPTSFSLSLKAQKPLQAKIEYTKSKINQEQEIPFKIPAKYTRTQK